MYYWLYATLYVITHPVYHYRFYKILQTDIFLHFPFLVLVILTFCNRVWQFAYVAYICMHTFIGVRMIILDMRLLICMLIFSRWLFKVFKIFLVLKILYCLKTYCSIFLIYFALYLWFSLEEADFLLFTFILKKPYFSYELFNKYFSLPQSTCRQVRVC